MNLTIVVPDKLVIVDGYAVVDEIDLTGLPEFCHAVQWYGNNGAIEFTTGAPNEEFIDISFCQEIIAAHAAIKERNENPMYTVEQAVEIITDKINAHKDTLQTANISYQDHNFYYDKETISETMQRCIVRPAADPVPTPYPITGYWKTADVEVNGQPVFVPFTCGEFIEFYNFCYDRNAKYWMAAQTHVGTVKGMAADPGTTAEDVLAYDFLGGWE